jgi:hypothetical protein
MHKELCGTAAKRKKRSFARRPKRGKIDANGDILVSDSLHRKGVRKLPASIENF